MTQSKLGLGRFSKEYISQIERGRVRPSPAALDWLADRLGVTRRFLETGMSSAEQEWTVALIARAEAAVAVREYEQALGCLEQAGPVSEDWEPPLALRALMADANARSELGRVKEALSLLERARDLAEGDAFTDVDRANVLFHMGRCRYKLSSIPTAVSLFTQALDLMHRSDLIDDRLRSRIFRWRSRCYRRQRDFEAAREDVEAALELSERLGDRDALANGYFQASIIAERNGQWVLARSHAERAKALFEEQDDRLSVGRLLNNLGGLAFLLGDPEEAERLLKAAFSAALEVGSEPDAAQAVSSLAQVHLHTGQVELAEQQARHALSLLNGRVDFLDEQGSAQLVLGRALLEQGRLDEAEQAMAASEATFEQLASASHRAAAWIAQAELSVRRGDQQNALRLYQLGGRDPPGRSLLGEDVAITKHRAVVVLLALVAASASPAAARAGLSDGTDGLSAPAVVAPTGFSDGTDGLVAATVVAPAGFSDGTDGLVAATVVAPAGFSDGTDGLVTPALVIRPD